MHGTDGLDYTSTSGWPSPREVTPGSGGLAGSSGSGTEARSPRTWPARATDRSTMMSSTVMASENATPSTGASTAVITAPAPRGEHDQDADAGGERIGTDTQQVETHAVVAAVPGHGVQLEAEEHAGHVTDQAMHGRYPDEYPTRTVPGAALSRRGRARGSVHGGASATIIGTATNGAHQYRSAALPPANGSSRQPTTRQAQTLIPRASSAPDAISAEAPCAGRARSA